MDITGSKDAAPAFLTSAGVDDASHARQTVEFFNSPFKVGVGADLHIYARRPRRRHQARATASRSEPGHRFQEWLADISMLNKYQAGVGPSFKGPIGLQLYSLREQFAKDVPATIDQTRSMGFEYVELAGAYNIEPETQNSSTPKA